jgi:HK97 family phage portal protein
MRLPFWKQKATHAAASAKSMLFPMMAARAMAQNYSAYAVEGYAQNPITFACIEKIALAMQSVDLTLYQVKGGTRVRIEGDHPLLALLNRPNPTTSGREFLAAMARYWMIGGNSYLYGVNVDALKPRSAPPKELYLLQPNHVTIKENPGGQFPLAYEYRPGNSSATTYPVNALTGKSAVLHLKTFDPLDKWRGMPPLMAAAFAADVFNAGQKWNLSLLQNGAQPSGALMLKTTDGGSKELSEDQYRRLKQTIEEQYSGGANAGRPMLLEGGLEWKEMSQTAKDMDHEKNMLNNARWIASVYGVPPMLVNIPGESTYSNFEQAQQALWTESVLPKLSMILDALNIWLAPMFGDGLEIWYDEEMIPALETLRKQKADRVNAASYMTINEKRRAMGLDDADSGDVILVPAGNIPLELAGSMDLPEPGSPAAAAAV